MSLDCAKCPASMTLVQFPRLVGQTCGPHTVSLDTDEWTMWHEEEKADITLGQRRPWGRVTVVGRPNGCQLNIVPCYPGRARQLPKTRHSLPERQAAPGQRDLHTVASASPPRPTPLNATSTFLSPPRALYSLARDY